MPFGIGLSAIGSFILGYAPDIIDTVGRLLAGRSGADKRLAAAKELFEVVKAGLDEEWNIGDLGDLNANKLLKAMEDEDVFVEKLANVNDAIYQFTKYVNEQEVA